MEQPRIIYQCRVCKKKHVYTMFFAILLFTFSNFSHGQLSGKVVDAETGEVLPGATISAEGTNYYAITDFNGNYEISNIPPGTYTILCSFIGYKNQTLEVTVNEGGTVQNFDLGIDLLQMDEVVVTGLASQNSKAVSTIAVQRVDAGELNEKANFNSVQELLSGKVAGVSIQSSGGGFGAATRFVVRSGGGINGNGQPLIFIDGVRVQNNTLGSANDDEGGGISSLVGLNPEDIEDVEIIKGPAGSASYGTGAANGVILITTKRGQAGKAWQVNYKGSLGFNDFRKLKESDFRNFQFMNDNFFRSGEVIKNNINISGGSDEIRTFLSVDRNKEEGSTPANNFEQTNIRLNMDFVPSNKFSLQTSTQYSSTEIAFPQRGRGGGEFGNLVFNPLPYDDRFDPLKREFYNNNERDINTINSFNGSVSGKYGPFVDATNWLNGFSLAFTAGLNERRNESLYLLKRTTEEVHGVDQPGQRSIFNSKTQSTTLTSNISYQYEVGKVSGVSVVGTQIFFRLGLIL
jgi:TonB-dependent SusC/RagA subfamily outer membrane receptor